MVLTTNLAYVPNSAYVYSDLGADLLGMIVEKVSGERLDHFLERRVFGPLGMRDTFYRPADSVRYRIAPTELTPPRGYPLQGEVHDENAYALGGIAGHAGLFSTAGDLSIFAQMMLSGGTYDGVHIISEPTVALFTRRTAGHRALGWDTARRVRIGTVSHRACLRAQGSGDVNLIDPDREMFVILLTNRVHAAKARHPGKIIMDVRADLSDAAVLAVVDGPTPMLAMPDAFRADREIGWNTVVKPVRCSAVKSRRGRSTRASRSRRVACAALASRRAKSSKSESRMPRLLAQERSELVRVPHKKKFFGNKHRRVRGGTSPFRTCWPLRYCRTVYLSPPAPRAVPYLMRRRPPCEADHFAAPKITST